MDRLLSYCCNVDVGFNRDEQTVHIHTKTKSTPGIHSVGDLFWLFLKSHV